MMYSNILVPYDNSASAHAALGEALKLAEMNPESEVRIINIVDTETAVSEKLQARLEQPNAPKPSGEVLRVMLDEVIAEADALLHHNIDPVLAQSQNRISIELIEQTSVGDQIITFARENECDIIVMGSRGAAGLRGILGSVSMHILRFAPVPVLIAKQPE